MFATGFLQIHYTDLTTAHKQLHLEILTLRTKARNCFQLQMAVKIKMPTRLAYELQE